MIDLKKKYTTRDGREVVLHAIVDYNSAGDFVTFPVKGSIITPPVSPGGRSRTTYAIWKRNGRADIFRKTGEDLLEIIT